MEKRKFRVFDIEWNCPDINLPKEDEIIISLEKDFDVVENWEVIHPILSQELYKRYKHSPYCFQIDEMYF